MSTQAKGGGLMQAFAERLSELIWERLSPAAIVSAKERIYDALGVACNALDEPVVRTAFGSVDAGAGPCTIIGRTATAGMADAAFVNAVTGHATLQEDLGGGGHPGTYIIPVALAVGEKYRCSGKQVLAAVATGYEAADRMNRAVPAQMQANGFRAVPAIGVFGAAATAATLLQLDAARLAAALDLAAHLAGGLYQPFVDGTMEGYLHAGFAARSGINAALLAQAGAVTSPLTLEGPSGFFRTFGSGSDGDTSVLMAPLGDDLALLRARSKPFPACALNQDTMLMIRALCPTALDEQQIDRLVLRRPKQGMNSFQAPGVANEPPYANLLQAQMSAKFTAIATLLGRPVTELSYFRESFADTQVDALARRTSLVCVDDEQIGLEVHLRDGQCLLLDAASVNDMRWDTHAVAARFAKLAAPVLHSMFTPIRDAIPQLETLPDVGALLRLFREAARQHARG